MTSPRCRCLRRPVPCRRRSPQPPHATGRLLDVVIPGGCVRATTGSHRYRMHRQSPRCCYSPGLGPCIQSRPPLPHAPGRLIAVVIRKGWAHTATAHRCRCMPPSVSPLFLIASAATCSRRSQAPPHASGRLHGFLVRGGVASVTDVQQRCRMHLAFSTLSLFVRAGPSSRSIPPQYHSPVLLLPFSTREVRGPL